MVGGGSWKDEGGSEVVLLGSLGIKCEAAGCLATSGSL